MITSEELLRFGRSNNPCLLSYLLSARDYRTIITKCVYADPNYGACWFRAKLFPLGSAEEVIIRTIKFTAHEVAIASTIYYNALIAYARCKQIKQQATVIMNDEINRDSTKNTSIRQQQPSQLSIQYSHFPSSSSIQYHNLISRPTTIRNGKFSFSFQPYQMIVYSSTLPIDKKLKILFGTSQIES